MKKSISIVLLFTLLIAPIMSVNAQKTRHGLAKTVKPQVTAPSQDTETAFASVSASAAASGVLVKWTMQQEVKNLGFNVYRLDSRSERLATDDMILGAATRFRSDAVAGESYEFFDAQVDADAVYFVEAVGLDGKSLRSSGSVPVQADKTGFLTESALDGPKIKGTPGANIVASSLTLNKELSKEVETNLLVPDPVNHRAVISRPGVKIGVIGEGFFRVTRAELQAGGFDVNGNSAFWQLYVNGVEQGLSIGPNADYIEFYGNGVDTVESEIQTYYLVTGDTAGKRILSRAIRPGTSTVVSNSYPETIIKKERTNYLQQIFNGDLENYFGRVIVSTATTVPFTVTGVDFSRPTATLTIGLLGYSFDQHQMEITLNGHPLTPATSMGRQTYSTTQTIPVEWLVEGTNNLQLRSAGPTGDISFFDNVRLSYSRKFQAEQNRIKSFTSNYKTTTIDGFSSANIRVFDITDPSSPVLMTNLPVVQNGAAFSVIIPAGRGRLFYAVEDTGLRNVQGIAANDPTLVSTSASAANLVIIAHKSLIAQAEAWATYRRSQGITVKVVEVSEIYDEFNYGVMSSESVKAFLAAASTTWQTPPGYALLMGDASYDSRNYQGTGYFNMVPTKFVTTIFTETGSDEALADFNNDGLAELAIGRIPVRTGILGDEILARQIAWEGALTAPLSRGVLFAFDIPGTYDFDGMSIRIRDQLPAGTPNAMIGKASPTGAADLITSMNTGKYLINYSGHGSTRAWSNTFFSANSVPQLNNPPASRSIYTMLTCLNGFFMALTEDSLAEVLLKASNGGAVAAWASSGETTPDVQEAMALRFYNQIGSGPANLNRLGDLIKDAKTQIPGGSDVRLSWALIGDPMLKVR